MCLHINIRSFISFSLSELLFFVKSVFAFSSNKKQEHIFDFFCMIWYTLTDFNQLYPYEVINMNDLSDKQCQILAFLKKEVRERGYPPSVREICEATGLKSTSTVHGHLARLEKKGYIRRDPTKPRAIEILDTSPLPSSIQDTIQVPIVGTVTAGSPIFAEENIIDTFPIPAQYLGKSNHVFMLKVKGESMIGAGIFDKDLILVNQQSVANNGEIVVALIEDYATVKTFYRENGHVRLQPENPAMSPILIRDCQILGKVIGLFRKF